MPLPVIAEGRVTEGNGKPQQLIDYMYSYAVINANIKNDANLVKMTKMFLKYCYTDISLNEFTVKSGGARGLNYDLTEESYSKLSYFQKTVWDAREAAIKGGGIIIPVSGDTVFTKNSDQFSIYTGGPIPMWTTVLTNNQSYYVPYLAFRSNVSAKDYFLGLAKDNVYWNSLNK